MTENFKKVLVGMLSIVMVMTMFVGITPRVYAEENIKVIVNGTTITFDQAPIIQNNRTLVPMRAIFESLGYTITWDGKLNNVTARKDSAGLSLDLTVGDDYTTIFKDDCNVAVLCMLDVSAQIINNRTLVPLRAIGEVSGCDVVWDGTTQTVTITTIPGLKFTKSSGVTTEGVKYNHVGYTKDGIAYGFGNCQYDVEGVLTTYIGNYVEGKPDGFGRYYYDDTTEYVGPFKNGAPNGNGILYFDYGERYEGAFVDGEFEGTGTYYYMDGTSKTGKWHNSEFVG